jgi:hypothetical protein
MLYLKNKKFSCNFCNEKHTLKENKVSANKSSKKKLKTNIDILNRTAVFKNAKMSFDIFNSKLDSLDLLNKDPVFFIEQHFSDLINDIDLRREDLKLRIDHFCDKIIEDLITNKSECIENVFDINKQTNDELNYFKNISDSFKKDLKTIDLNEKKCRDIEKQSKVLVNKVDYEIREKKNFLLMNKMYDFKQPEILFNPKNVFTLEIKKTESLVELKKEIDNLKKSIEDKIDNGKRKKFQIKDYDELKTWNDLSHDEKSKLKSSFSPSFLEKILTQSDQSEHLKFLNEIDKNQKSKKSYTVISKNNLTSDKCWRYFIIFKDYNTNYQHEFLNNFGFLVLVKDAKYERV